jgi:hypothetical protein
MSLEQGNQLLRGARDANDRIRDQNNAATRTWESTTKPMDEASKEAEAWYHGIGTSVSAQHFSKSAYDTGQRMKNLGKGGKSLSYGELASLDTRNVGNNISRIGQGAVNNTISSVKSGISTASNKVGATVQSVGKTSLGLDKDLDIAGSSKYVPAVKSAVKTVVKPAVKTTVKSAEDIGKISETSAAGTEGTLGEKAIEKVTGAGVGSAMNIGIGKVAGNIAGAVDVVKDFENMGKKGGFLGGTGATTGDEISNALTIGGSALDIASIALPFLAPIAAGVSLVGAGLGTYEGIKDADDKENNDKANYTSHKINQEIAPSLAGTGFLASQQSNPTKLITGSSSF